MTTNNYLSLTTFVPGTKAKADEVNSNFNILKEALMTKAQNEGDSSQNFYVADAINDMHAVNKSQLNDAKIELQQSFDCFGYRFCIKSANTTDGSGDLFDYSNLTVTPKIGGSYQSLIFADYTGLTHTITASEDFTMQGKPDGTYNVFINSEGEIYTVSNNIYTQPSRPNLVDDDIWLDTSCEPLRCIKYVDNEDIEFLDIPIGKIVIEGGIITEITTNDFVSNGYDVTYNNLPQYKYDYSNPISKSFGQNYTAECDGLIYVLGSLINTTCNVTVDGVAYTIHISSSQGSHAGGFIPINKGQEYSSSAGSSLKFIPKIKI